MGPKRDKDGNVLLQWGRFPEEAETWEIFKQAARTAALQWGRFPEEAETSGPASHTQSERKLQWGRFPEEAETLQTSET